MATSKIVIEIQSRTEGLVHECAVTWSIGDFSFSEDAEKVTSPRFTTEADSSFATWQIELCPNGDGYIGIKLSRISFRRSDCMVEIDFSIIDSNKQKLKSLACAALFNNEGSDCVTRLCDYWFIARDLVENYLLSNDTLTVLCELKVPGNQVEDISTPEITSDSVISRDYQDFDSLVHDLQELFENKMSTDFTINVGNEELKVHKIILCARSSVFNTMLKCDMQEALTNCMDITDFDPPVVKTMLKYIYHGKVQDLTSEMSLELYSIADKYNIPSLKDICVKFLLGNLNLDTICDALMLADLHNEQELMQRAKAFFCVNAAVIQETEKWLNVTEEMPALAIAMYRHELAQRKAT